MAAAVEDRVFDFGLLVFSNETSIISVCQAEPTTIAIAATSGCSDTIRGAQATRLARRPPRLPVDAKSRRTRIGDGTVTTCGTASWWAAYAPGTLHAHGPLAEPVVVTAGDAFNLSSFELTAPVRKPLASVSPQTRHRGAKRL